MRSTESLKALAETGTLNWAYDDDWGGEWIRHVIGNGFDAIINHNEDGPGFSFSITEYDAPKPGRAVVLFATNLNDIAEAEAYINDFRTHRMFDNA